MNGMQCGPLSETATEDDLYKDSYMELMPIDFLLDEDKAEEKNTLAAYHRLTSTRQETRSFYNFSRHEFITHGKAARTWVGFERFATRTCGKGDKSVQLSQNSFVFFGKYDNVVLNVTGLMERNKGHEVIIREETPFHVTFSEASISNKEDSAEHVCPFVRPVRRIVPKGEVRMCFPAGVVVEVSDGRRVQMNKLKIGDRIRDGTNGYSEVFMFSHRDSSSFRNEFVKLKTARGASVTLSRGHLLRTRGGLRSAGEMRVGEGVMTSGKEDEDVIVWKGLVYEDGLYNPHTISGEFIVNGIVVSCYTTAVWPITAHALLAPLRAAYIVGRLLPKLREVGGGLRRVGLRQMVDIAKISTF